MRAVVVFPVPVLNVNKSARTAVKRKELTWWTAEKECKGQLIPWIHALVPHIGGNVLILFQLGDNTLTAHNSFEKHLNVGVGALRAIVVRVKVLRLEDGRPGYTIASKALLLHGFRIIQQNVNLASVAEVGPVAHPTKDVQGDASGFSRSGESLGLELSIKDDSHFLVAEVFEQKSGADGKAPGESGVGLLHHLLHLLLVAKQQYAPVVSRNILHFGNDGVDNSGLVGIR